MTLNYQGKNKIDWTDWTWNPISGCKHNCSYCYIKAMDKRFKSNIMEPAWYPERLSDLKSKMLKFGDKVFVGSSGDMWGNWVQDDWIGDVLDMTEFYPGNIFQFLTKNPVRYSDFKLDGMDNCWFGTTFDGTYKTIDNIRCLLDSVPCGLKFVSFEPLIENPVISIAEISKLDWMIIGADSSQGAKKPEKEWADRLIYNARQFNIPVFVKDNYGYPEIIKEFPNKIEVIP